MSHPTVRVFLLLLLNLGARDAFADGAAPDTNAPYLQAILGREILSPAQVLSEVQDYLEPRVPAMPALTSAKDWTRYADRLRADILKRVVLRGEAARWAKQPLKVEWLDTIPGGPGYHIRKLRYEAVPGFWIPALLYEPDAPAAKMPVVLNVSGHDPNGKSAAYKQVHCINQVKRGMLALNVEWIGMGQLSQPNYTHSRMNQLDLCGTSGVAPFYLSLKRGLDVLLAQPAGRPAARGRLEEDAIARLELQNSFPSLKTVIQQNHTFEQMPEMFCFGLLETFDMEQLKALVTPRPVVEMK